MRPVNIATVARVLDLKPKTLYHWYRNSISNYHQDKKEGKFAAHHVLEWDEQTGEVTKEQTVHIFKPGNEKWRPEGISKEDLLAVFSGTHGTANGLNAVLDAAAELKQRNRDDIKFVLIGDGQQKAELVSRAVKEGIDNIIFLDPVGKAELAKLLSGADIGLQILANVPAFFYGTSPNKFFDYISAGLPVLTNYPGWVADSIHEHDCGFAIPPSDPSAFADALEAAAVDRKSLGRKGAAARKLAEEKFSRQYLSSQFVGWVTGNAVPQAKRP